MSLSQLNKYTSISLQHISANANPMFHSIDLLGSHVIYAAQNQVLVHNPDTLKTLVSLNLNNQNVYADKCNCVAGFQDQDGKGYIVSAYSTGHVAIYSCKQGGYQSHDCWSLNHLVKQPESVIIVRVFKVEDKHILATLNNKAQVTLYQVGKDKLLVEIQKIEFPLNKIPESIDLTLSGQQIILAIAGADQLIHCYISPVSSIDFQYSTSLKGHQNAITKLCFHQNLLASSSKDGYIRIWKICLKSQVPEFQKSLFQLTETQSVYLESILISHQNNVTNLTWGQFDALSLVSVSWDCTINVWQHDSDNWAVKNRLGQLYGNKNAFFGIIANTKDQYIQSINFTGASCVWKFDPNSKTFVSRPSFTGHFNEVRGIEWSQGGEFLISVSKDQTTRVLSRNQQTKCYSEVSRAQIHGYDINCVTLIKLRENTIDHIACGADQKIIRVIEPPANVANLLNYFTRANLHLYFQNVADQEQYIVKKNKDVLQYTAYTEGGTQVLGLMTKVQAVQKQKISSYYQKDEEDDADQQETRTGQVSNIDYTKPPTEDYLVKHTLWPQINKLYGHPYQMNSLAASADGKYLASHCKSLTKECAFTIIWDTQSWKILHTISHHKSTVNDVCFSPSGLLLTVSKDRTLALFNSEFKLEISLEAHSRAVTSGHISADSKYIVTGSRDKTVKVTSIQTKSVIATYQFKQPVHSVRFSPSGYYIAVGGQNGQVSVLEFQNNSIVQLARIDDYVGHSAVVNCLRWKDRMGQTLLASCSNDHTTRIYRLEK